MYGKSVKASSRLFKTYQIEAELGSGGSGAIYKAWHTRLRKHVVIKIVKECSPGAVEVHRNEVEALKNIKNMHIPQVLDFIVERNRSFTIMEYIDGESFDKLLGTGQRFNELQVIKWYIQLASALCAIHKHDVCHCDIKPSNIMLMVNGDVCLIDFNSALVSGNNTGVISRSMGYASPEQYEYFKLCRDAFLGAAEVYSICAETVLLAGNCKTEPVFGSGIKACTGVQGIDWKLSDIYSLGAAMYHFLTGNRPPVKAGEVAIISKLSGYNECILSVIERSMRTEPSGRFTSAEELIETLRDIMRVMVTASTES